MTDGLYHTKVSGKSDGGDSSLVLPSDWNNRHRPKMNFAATVAPTASNDTTQDYEPGSRWLDTTAKREYVCVSAATSAAVWIVAGLGSWQTYAPSWTSDGTAPAIGNGTISGRYRLLDESSMQLIVYFKRGSSSTNGTGTYFFSMPSGYKISTLKQNLAAFLLDAGTRWYGLTAVGTEGNTKFHLTGDVLASAGLFGHTVPITLATNDELSFSGLIEYALV